MSKLQAKDLMIGDWVCFDGDTEYTNPVQINGISTEEACVDGDWYDVWEPIPLTTEILEKNFPDTEILVWYGHEDKWHIECPAFEDLQVEIEIKWIHQLQHALRLCGIEKEVQL